MALSTVNAGAVVSGAPAGQNMEMTKVKVLRAFWNAGERVDVGTVITVPRALALDLMAVNKAEAVDAAPAKAAVEEEPTPSPKKQASRKGGASK